MNTLPCLKEGKDLEAEEEYKKNFKVEKENKIKRKPFALQT